MSEPSYVKAIPHPLGPKEHLRVLLTLDPEIRKSIATARFSRNARFGHCYFSAISAYHVVGRGFGYAAGQAEERAAVRVLDLLRGKTKVLTQEHVKAAEERLKQEPGSQLRLDPTASCSLLDQRTAFVCVEVSLPRTMTPTASLEEVVKALAAKLDTTYVKIERPHKRASAQEPPIRECDIAGKACRCNALLSPLRAPAARGVHTQGLA